MAWQVFNPGTAAASRFLPHQKRAQSPYTAHNGAWDFIVDPVIETIAVLHIAEPDDVLPDGGLPQACAQWFACGGQTIICHGPRTRAVLLAQLRDLGFCYATAEPGVGQVTDAEDWWLVAQSTVPDRSWQLPPSLADGVVALRSWLADDFSAVEAASPGTLGCWPQPEPTRFAEWLVAQNGLLVSGQGHTWCVADAHSGHALGVLHLRYDRRNECADLAAVIFPSGQGRGAGTAATRLVADWAVRSEQLGGAGLQAVHAVTPLGDVAAADVLAAAGFDVVGRSSSSSLAGTGGVEATRWRRRLRSIR